MATTHESADLATRLRVARLRLGWSRETLAHRSGLSWSAITQIESGRRVEVRLGTLTALARALAVTLDYLATGKEAPGLLMHRALTYSTDEELTRCALEHLVDRVAGPHAVLVVAPSRSLGGLGDALSGAKRSNGLELQDASQWYTTPAAAANRYRNFVNEALDGGAAWVHIFGEPVWSGRTAKETLAWSRYESLLNLSLLALPVSLFCLYDTRTVPRKVLDDMPKSHLDIIDVDGCRPSTAYIAPEQLLTTGA
jgi:transcriptional regulator with XRE-family HTH domain